MYGSYPGIRKGRHYWSFSWMPGIGGNCGPDLNDDLQLLSGGKRTLMSAVKAVPNRLPGGYLGRLPVRHGGVLTGVWFELSVGLGPTFALSLFGRLSTSRDGWLEVLKNGHWGAITSLRGKRVRNRPGLRPGCLNGMGVPGPGTLFRFWPHLALISAWDASTSAIWAQQLQALFPGRLSG